MDNNTPINSASGMPPASPQVDIVLPGTGVTPEIVKAEESKQGAEWPTKKKSKVWQVVGGLAAIVLVVGVSIGAFYFTRNLNQASVPNAPESKPLAVDGDDWKGTARNATSNEVNSAKTSENKSGTATQGVNYTQSQMEEIVASNPSEGRTGGALQAGNNQGTSQTTNAAGQTLEARSGFYVVVGNDGEAAYRAIGTPDQERGGRGGGEEAAVSTPNTVADCTVSSWTPAANTVCSGTEFTQTNNCGGTRTKTGTKTGSSCVACNLTQPSGPSVEKLSPTSVKLKWTPGTGGGTAQYLYVSKHEAPVKNCEGTEGNASLCFLKKTDLSASASSYTLTGLTANTTYYWNVQNHLNATCNKYLGDAASFKTDVACTNTTWTPDASTKCEGVSFVQTSNCSATQSATGTKTTGECETIVDLEVLKTAYRDQSTNKPGDYKLTSEIDVVSKEQIFVYAIDVVNNGNVKAENVVISDVLKGDNQELLSFVDAEARCKYASATRTVTCSGMNLDPDESDTYTFRVKVSAEAINGDTIINTVVVSYKDMPDDGETEESLELTISTIVGCNHTCTSDDECVSGLSCDLTTNKCRRPTCSDASNCNCSVERVVTEAPARVATARPVQPTVLPETGILDLPGVATFGGGLLLAIIGILLAL